MLMAERVFSRLAEVVMKAVPAGRDSAFDPGRAGLKGRFVTYRVPAPKRAWAALWNTLPAQAQNGGAKGV
jgi:hypothetical protein